MLGIISAVLLAPGFTVRSEPPPPVEACVAVFTSGLVRVGSEAVPSGRLSKRVPELVRLPTTNLGVYFELPTARPSAAYEDAMETFYGDTLEAELKKAKKADGLVQLIMSERPDCSDLSVVPATDKPQ